MCFANLQLQGSPLPFSLRLSHACVPLRAQAPAPWHLRAVGPPQAATLRGSSRRCATPWAAPALRGAAVRPPRTPCAAHPAAPAASPAPRTGQAQAAAAHAPPMLQARAHTRAAPASRRSRRTPRTSSAVAASMRQCTATKSKASKRHSAKCKVVLLT